jgi:hypothetical protein
MVVGVAACLAIVTWSVSSVLDGELLWYVLGLVHAGLVAACLHLLFVGHLAFDREAIWHVRGAWGEDNTRSELQRAKRRHLVWGWVDSVSLQAGDLDHVVVARRGGLVVIDSKWRSDISVAERMAMADAAVRARRRTEGLARSLLTSEKGARHRARTQPLTAIPVIAIWGSAQHTVPKGGVEIDGVRFLAGRDLVPWLRTLDGDAVQRDAAADALNKLKTFRAGTREGG